MPIGPRLRNLNRDIVVNHQAINQLAYFQKVGIIEKHNLNNIQKMPSYNNTNISLEKRARAYFDINCAHCHRAGGMTEYYGYDFDYNTPLSKTGIIWGKETILEQMNTKKMPYVGTSVIDEEGLKLITDYINSLNTNYSMVSE